MRRGGDGGVRRPARCGAGGRSRGRSASGLECRPRARPGSLAVRRRARRARRRSTAPAGQARMTRRVALRLALLVVGVVAVLVGLTAYFSSEKIPPCLVAGAPKWRPPTDRGLHRFLLVVPDRALCFYSIDDGHKLVGAVKLRGIEGIDAIQPRASRLAVRYRGGHRALFDIATGRFARIGEPPPSP